MSEDILKSVRQASKGLANALETFGRVAIEIEGKRKDIAQQMIRRIEQFQLTKFNVDALDTFVRTPYITIPLPTTGNKAQEWLVIVPKIFDFNLGWLEYSTPSYNVFKVNKYVPMFGYNVPEQLIQKLDIHTLPIKVSDGLLLVEDTDLMDHVWTLYKKHLSRRKGKNAFHVKVGNEYQLIADIIDGGTLPFIPRQVDFEDILPWKPFRIEGKPFELRDYQEEAWNSFLKYGAVGIYYPFGTGKSRIGEYALARLKGEKMVIVSSLTLKEQWLRRLEQDRIQGVRVETYAVVNSKRFKKIQKTAFTLVVYDECQHLPANTFIKLSTLNTKYRIGLSGSPYREDGRVNLIIALTGWPIGLAWDKFFDLGIIRKPRVIVRLVKNMREKLSLFHSMMQVDYGKTLVFCDSLDLGRRLKIKYGIEFIYGETTNRIEKIEANKVVIISRVGDEGLSIPDIDTIIEIDFLYGSRMQQSQRLGRLLHSKKEATNHYILMTEEEFQKYGKRLNSLYERGFNIEIVR